MGSNKTVATIVLIFIFFSFSLHELSFQSFLQHKNTQTNSFFIQLKLMDCFKNRISRLFIFDTFIPKKILHL